MSRMQAAVGRLRACRPSRWSAADLLLAAGIAVVALLPRAADLDAFLTPDETRWACRSANFHAALAERDWARTYQKEHPGVITMWLGGLAMGFDPEGDYAVACRDVPASKLITAVPRPTLDAIRDRLFAGRLRVAIAVSLAIGLTYLAARRSLGRGAALLAAALLAFDPFYLAHARVLHLDALTATLTTLSLVSLTAALCGERRAVWLVASGGFAGLAGLEKSPALFLGPFVALVLAIDARGRGRSGGSDGSSGRGPARLVRSLAVWGGAMAATWCLMWPAMWAAPVDTLTQVLRGALGYAEDPHEGSNFFLGVTRPDPGPLFYPTSWLLRSSVLALVGVLLAVWSAARRRLEGDQRRAVIVLTAFSALFCLFMTVGAKKFDRYLLPVHPALDLVAAVGWVSVVPALGALRGPRAPRPPGSGATVGLSAALAVALAMAGALLALPHRPYYLTYYNPLAGGSAVAQRALLVGWGEGLDVIARHLDARPDAAALEAASYYRSAFGPLFAGRTVELDDYDPASVDYFVLYRNQLQRGHFPELVERLRAGGQPEHVARLAGIDYAWLYANPIDDPVVALLARRARAGDALLVRSDSGLARGVAAADGTDLDLHVRVFDPDAPADEILAQAETALGNPRAWYVRYDDAFARAGLRAADQAIARNSHVLAEHRFDGVSVRLLLRAGPLGAGSHALGSVRKVDAGFDSSLQLRSLRLPASAAWGRPLTIDFEWQARGAIGRDLTVFGHLLAPDGRRVAQVDAPIVDEDMRPTSQWPEGTEVRGQAYALLPPGTPAVTHTLRFGVYDGHTGERLSATVGGQLLPEGTLDLQLPVRWQIYQPEVEDLGLDVVVERPIPSGRGLELELLGLARTSLVEGGGTAGLDLLWRVLAPPKTSPALRLTLSDAAGRTVGNTIQEDLVPGLPAADWPAGKVVRTHAEVPIDGRALAGAGRLLVGLLEGGESGARQETASIDLPLAIDGPVRSFAVPADVPHPVGAVFADALELLAYDAGAPTQMRRGWLGFGGARLSAPVGATVPVTLVWRVGREVDIDYRPFVHLVGPDGIGLDGQSDGWPPGEKVADSWQRPPGTWLAGEVFTDTHHLRIAPDAPAGRYTLRVGMYDPAAIGANVRPVQAGGAVPSDGRVLLGPIEVTR